MTSVKELNKKINNSIKLEIKKLRNTKNKNSEIYNYLHKNFKKIFIKLTFPYFRFEILFQAINDSIKNISNYPPIFRQQADIIKQISDKLKIICLHFNIALDEYNELIIYIEKNLK